MISKKLIIKILFSPTLYRLIHEWYIKTDQEGGVIIHLLITMGLKMFKSVATL